MGKLKSPIPRTCPICGKEFWTQWDSKVYCSDLCKRQWNKTRPLAQAPEPKIKSPMFRAEIEDPIKKCPRDCYYQSRSGATQICEYILLEHKPRGCPGGKNCKRYTNRKREERKNIWETF